MNRILRGFEAQCDTFYKHNHVFIWMDKVSEYKIKNTVLYFRGGVVILKQRGNTRSARHRTEKY